MRKKKFLKSMGGVIALGSSIYLFYLFLNTLNNGANFLYFGLSIVLVAAAVFAFVQADKYKQVSEQIIIDPNLNMDKESVLDKNNKMAAEFGKTFKAKEELKMLELANTPSKD